MATSLDTPHPDIERTDELPQLDVAEYEKNLNSSPTIVRTQLERTEVHASRGEPAPTIIRSKSTPASIPDDIEDTVKAIAGLKAENARLVESRAIGEEMIKRLEHKLREQSAQHAAQLTQMQSARVDERIEKVEELKALLADEQTSVEQLALQLATKLRECDALKELVSAGKRTVDDLRARAADSVEDARRADDTIARLSDELATANRELAALRAGQNTHADEATWLQRRLGDSEADVESLRSQMQRVAQQYAAESERLQSELESVRQQHATLTQQLASREAEQSAAQQSRTEHARQLSDLQASLQAAQADAAALQRELTSTRAAIGEEQRRRHAVEEKLRAEQLDAEGLRAGLDFARSQLEDLGKERDSLLSLRDEMGARTSAVEHGEELLAAAQGDIATLHGELGAQTQAAHEREAQLAAAQAALAELRRERDGQRQDLELAHRTAQAMQDELRLLTERLQARASELAKVKQELEEQAPALSDLKHALRTRDEKSSQLHEQLQDAQDEQSLLSGQLYKMRQRVRSMADQIFERDNQIAALRAELATHADALAAIRRDVDRVEGHPDAEVRFQAQHVLMPVEHGGEPIALDRPVISIGRTPDNDVCLPSKLVSRRHARLSVGAGGVTVEDAGSTNGCHVNGVEVTQRVLQEGDILELGELRFRLVSPATATQVRDNVVHFSSHKD